MKPDQAAKLFRLLVAAHPREKIGSETTEVWLGELRGYESSIGETAIRSLIVVWRKWPPVAAFHEQAAIARQQAARKRREEERRAADAEIEPPRSDQARLAVRRLEGEEGPFAALARQALERVAESEP